MCLRLTAVWRPRRAKPCDVGQLHPIPVAFRLVFPRTTQPTCLFPLPNPYPLASHFSSLPVQPLQHLAFAFPFYCVLFTSAVCPACCQPASCCTRSPPRGRCC